ncbi:hypothetical protein F5Y19DRAFT_452998 [Xylariaceae sp. FL1651]|nr:hypothetical protein F5Y19DRAFT_452998 [Xylariaceae sp. FL1651]
MKMGSCTIRGKHENASGQTVTSQQESVINGVSYHYTQIFCGFCGHFVTDIGGFVSASFAAAMESGQRQTPGASLLGEQTDLFTHEVREHVVLKKGPWGLAKAIDLIVPVRPDPLFPRLYLRPHLCYHDLDAKELQRLSRFEKTAPT